MFGEWFIGMNGDEDEPESIHYKKNTFRFGYEN